MVEKKRPGDDSLSTLNTAAEVNEMDYKEGQRRKAGQMDEEPKGAAAKAGGRTTSDATSMAESDEDMG